MRLILFAIVLNSLSANAYGFENVCKNKSIYIEIQTQQSLLLLCDNSSTPQSFRVSFGKGGFNKKVQGDNKTPLGSYSLGTPRSSNRFFIFIPIGYPTDEQKKNGFTGGDVGIHGPLRFLSWIGRVNTWFDWTQGCIAVGSEEEIGKISDWVVANKVVSILIY